MVTLPADDDRLFGMAEPALFPRTVFIAFGNLSSFKIGDADVAPTCCGLYSKSSDDFGQSLRPAKK
jgi:hypothetical protein